MCTKTHLLSWFTGGFLEIKMISLFKLFCNQMFQNMEYLVALVGISFLGMKPKLES